MANILKATKTYTDTHENTYSDAYMRIVAFTFFNVDDKRALYHVCVWKDSTARTNGSEPILRFEIDVTGADFDTYFADSVLDDADKSPLSQAYVHMGTVQPEITGVTWEDWTADEEGGVPQTITHDTR